ncbi:uncharacterized protein BX663DRAFT_552596 [Cokeromyces recurvatus]|uniref:uncharacterized protein n=1 Tax=Cokeromyces recurvatus TaxID=90255 RepID=UPI00221FBD5D|nr:uncharacterized protein BX663DRAFT_552596 [Cokeromyces recurvatus]KAI7902173.1 hypothetical protein BX663DRAFT_552596 [Cokeromyces recurvatus]
MSGGNIKVVVRCRPMNAREIARGAVGLVRMDGNQTIITKPPDQRTGKELEDVKAFTFDKSYWSADKNDPRYADQQTIYNDLGEELLDHAFDGYNCCIFAYGQTGSGKSYSMMGYGEDKGIIPRTCSELFNRIKSNTESNLTYRVEVSYIEIYNEKVRDLLNPKNKGNLKVREHPSLGPYVEDLSRLVVTSFDDIEHLMDEGNKARTVAATNMNETSSRSHAVFTLFLTQKRLDDLTKLETEKVARISLVDLAGSERANSTGATGARLKEGANINRSLTTLGKVIAGLAEQSTQEGKRGKKKDVFIPYRDSVLTWLLKDSLGGNSKTAMIAAISQADYDETLSTLRYADQAKRIKNKAVVNEDPNAKLIRDLKEELELLRDRLRTYAPEEVEQLTASSVYKSTTNNTNGTRSESGAAMTSSSRKNKVFPEIEITDSSGNTKKMTKEEIVEQLQSSEKLLANLNESWEEKLKKTEEIHLERERALKELGITIEKNEMGVYTPKTIPFIVNLNEDPLMSECLMYQIKPGLTRLGRQDSDVLADIRLSGQNIQDDHCTFENKNGVVTLNPGKDSLTMVNGMRITQPQQLKSGYRIILGYYHIFRFNNPEEVRKERDLQKVAIENNMNGSSVLLDDEPRPDSPSNDSMIGSELIDWNYARREAVLNYYATEENFGGLKDEELEKLYDDITKIRNSRRTRSESRADNDGDDDDMSTTRDSFRNSSSATMFEDGVDSVCTDLSVTQSDMLEEKLKQEKERMQKELENQKRLFEAKIHRMSRQFSQQQIGFNSANYTNEQIELIQKVFQKWRTLRTVDMAEVVLTNAVMLKEANIISRELNKEILYQFTVIEQEPLSTPLSYWEPTSALHQFETDEDTTLISTTPKPCIGVRVIDKKNQVVYIWSLEKLKQRLHKMRNLYNFMDKPLYRKHFNWEDPFFENPCPKYTLIGVAHVSFFNLIHQQAYESVVEIICHSTGQVRGKLRILVSPIARSVTVRSDTTKQPKFFENDSSSEDELENNNNNNNNQQQHHDPNILQSGQTLLFEIKLIEFSGIRESEFTDVHVQFRLSSFGGFPSHSTAEKIYATEPASYFENNPVQLNFSQTLSLTVTSKVLHVLRHDFILFQVFGQAQPRVLLQQQRWDDQRERPCILDSHLLSQQRPQSFASPDYTSVKSSSENSSNSDVTVTSLERRPEEELLAAERHDVIAWIEIRELSSSGEYRLAHLISKNPMDKGYFTLRQGLQRRICFTLSHTSGHQFEWKRIKRASVGHVRLLDGKGRILESPAQENIPIKLLNKQQVCYNSDGTSQLTAQGAWDSSQHECIFLNRLTDSNSRVIINLRWEIEMERCSKPIQFNMDISIQIRGRDRSASEGKFRSFKKLLYPNSGKQLFKYTGIFVVHLKPPMTKRLSQLWRLNTASKHVHGEEFLGTWKPRGVSLVNDFNQIQETIRRKNEATFTRQVLALRQMENTNSLSPISFFSSSTAVTAMNEEEKQDLLKKVIDLWLLKLGSNKDLIISQDPPLITDSSISTIQEPTSFSKLIAEVEFVIQPANISKKGYLLYQEDAAKDLWIKRWFVIRRPYIYIYSNDTELDEQGIINVASVRIDYNEALEKMIQRTNVFSLYTNNNAYTLQSGTRQEMISWIQMIDQKFPIETLSP